MSALHAHPVFITKYRRPVCTGDMLTYCEHTMREVCGQLAAALVEFNGQADQLHPLLAYPRVLATSTLVPRLNGRTAHAVRREYTGRCNRAHMRGHP